ncbi:MAG TPA: metalloregulator ArsR/SmtB family transcription factor [Salinivirgaceae bacterium]|nr:metalloregulator ArsR/SmtB family transcription factor [Salinivirgaceae bacterium]
MTEKIPLNLELLERSSNMLKALAHPLRIEIVDLLQDNKKLTVGQIQKHLNITQSATSHHLGILKYNGIVTSQRDGKKMYYELKHQRLSQVINCVALCASEEK